MDIWLFPHGISRYCTIVRLNLASLDQRLRWTASQEIARHKLHIYCTIEQEHVEELVSAFDRECGPRRSQARLDGMHDGGARLM